jgi:hypothetical protein
MLTIQEQEKMKKILEVLNEEQSLKRKRRISERSRDEQGKFLPESPTRVESKSYSDRLIKVVKAKGSYNTYLIKERLLTDSEKDILAAIGVIILFAIIF